MLFNKKIKILFYFFITLSLVLWGGVSFAQMSLATQLGWVNEINPYNICGGYYRSLPIHYTPNPFVTAQDQNYDVTADQVTYAIKGKSTFKGNVVVTQPTQQATSDRAYVHANKKTGKAESIDLIGHVHLKQADKLMVGTQGHINLITKAMTLHNVSYRMALRQDKTITVKNQKTGKLETHLYQMTARGIAKSAKQLKPHLFEFKSATYSTCSPNCHDWSLHATTFHLDKKTGRGTSWNTRLHVLGIPVFYWPYFNFPIDHRRYSGFLTPSFGSNARSGTMISIPYYFNLAPNYDATFTPTFMSKRGMLWNLLFRYLTPLHQGRFRIGYISSDRGFERFKKHALVDWAGRPTLDELEKDSANRLGFSWQNHTQFNPHWAGDIDYNYVRDDYFIKDFGKSDISSSNNQLLRQAKLTYSGDHWDFLGKLQYYQTLHPVNEADVANQYSRLPELQYNAAYPDALFGLNYSLKTQFVRFWKKKNPQDAATAPDPVVGNRIAVRPAVSWPLNWPFAYFQPRIQVQFLKNNLRNELINFPDNPSKSIPILDVKSGLYFDRSVELFHNEYRQTLEPEVYYLYVPYRDQNDIPFFDTSVQAFTYDLMFQDNRFSGIDRIGDTNQVTLGVTTRFVDPNTGDEKANFSIGQIHYLTHRKVYLYYGPDASQPNDFMYRRPVSPIAMKATYHFNPAWSATANIDWNTKFNDFDDELLNFQYRPDSYHILNVGYHYQRGGDAFPGMPPNNLKQTDVSFYWHLTAHWSAMARWNYNWSHGHDQAYVYGLTYESCCWAIRFLNARTYVGLYPAPNPDYRNQYDRTFYIEFALKGLGNISRGGDPTSILSSSISGYVDTFGQEN